MFGVVAAAERYCRNDMAAWTVVAESLYLVLHSNKMVQMLTPWDSFSRFDRAVLFPWVCNVGWLHDYRPAVKSNNDQELVGQDLYLVHALMTWKCLL